MRAVPEESTAEVELSIVIPTYQRPRGLRACIESLIAQEGLPPSLELIVVLDGPDPATEEMLGALQPPFPLRVIVQDHARQAAARNRGVEEARGRYVLFIDDDIVAGERLVAAHLQALRAGDRVVGIGRIDKVLSARAPRWSRSRQTVWRRHYDRLASGREPRFSDTYGGNLSLPRIDFLAVGGFALDLTPEEDVEFGWRLWQAGMTFVYLDDAVAREEDRDTLQRFVADSRRRGVVGVMLYERHPGLLPHLRLGGAGELPRKWIAARRIALALRLPPNILAGVARLAPSEAFARSWLSFLYSYCYSRGVRESVDRETWRRLQRGTAILMYHALGRRGESPSRWILPRSQFERQLSWLKRRRYQVIGLDEFVRSRLEHRLPPPKSVVITFDDGYADNAELALPALERYGFPATLFLVSAAGAQAGWDRVGEAAGRALLRPDDARSLNGRLGFGAHSRTHPSLPRLTADELEREVSGSRSELEAALGAPVTVFSYPYGERSPEVEQAVATAGYVAACTIEPGRNRPSCDPYALKRLEVRGTDSLLRFAATLSLGKTRRGS
jgi:peptidoglycan/xylan/chitin deacetylase (PgdA/CDA1 family)/glycosyltransferase involved in cell wall biosynthesis